MTELFLLGLFENLTDGELFGIFCGLVVELPRNVYVFRKPNKRAKQILRDVRMVFISISFVIQHESRNSNWFGNH